MAAAADGNQEWEKEEEERDADHRDFRMVRGTGAAREAPRWRC